MVGIVKPDRFDLDFLNRAGTARDESVESWQHARRRDFKDERRS